MSHELGSFKTIVLNAMRALMNGDESGAYDHLQTLPTEQLEALARITLPLDCAAKLAVRVRDGSARAPLSLPKVDGGDDPR